MSNKKFFTHSSLPEMYELDVGDGNSIYLEISGRKDGLPILFLHGGPGGHCRSEHHGLFDPNIFKSIIYDQRGCGKSKPYRILEKNDTNNLINDIEIIREFLKIDKLFILGGSWGATLALCYAQAYPKNVRGIILRSVFLGTMAEIYWAFIDGPKIFAPELFQSFSEKAKSNNSKKIIEFYIEQILCNKSVYHSWIWHDYERILSQINPDSHSFDSKEKILQRQGCPNSPLMETHFIKNKFFIQDNQIFNNMKKIEHIPGYIVQGRYDLICPPVNAFKLHEKWKNSNIKLVNTAGHSSSDEGITENLSVALEQIKNF